MPTKYRPEGQDPAVKRFRAIRGQATDIARECGIERAAVYQWKRVPAQWIHQVAQVTGMKPEDIRPDIFRPRRKRA
jgi:hypothetical protein